MTPEEAARKSESKEFEVEYQRMAKYLKQHLKQKVKDECEKPLSWDDLQKVALEATKWVQKAFQQECLGWPDLLVDVFILHQLPDFYQQHGFNPQVAKKSKRRTEGLLRSFKLDPEELNQLKKEVGYD